MKPDGAYKHLAIVFLRAALVFVLFVAGWQIYKRLPPTADSLDRGGENATTVQIVMRNPDDSNATSLSVEVDLYPVDIVAVQHEYFTEPRPAKSYWDFFREKMKGRVTAQLDKDGRASVKLTPGTWWLHAKLVGDEELEWRLPMSVSGPKQVIELTAQNAYTRSKTF